MKLSIISYMTDDAILSQETFLLYQNAYGFEPIQGNLTQWRGVVRDRNGQAAEMKINIPNHFPFDPPEFLLPTGTQHPVADQNGNILTRSMHRWKSTTHVYQVLREVRQAIASSSFTQATTVNQTVQSDVLNRQIETLKQSLQMKKDELKELESTPTSSSNISVEQVAEESILNIESDIYALEDSFDRLEIDDVKFAKKFVSLRKRYYNIQASLK